MQIVFARGHLASKINFLDCGVREIVMAVFFTVFLKGWFYEAYLANGCLFLRVAAVYYRLRFGAVFGWAGRVC